MFQILDIDYSVFTDAAKFMLKGESPYQRATFRYTPLLAILLTPCHFNSLGYLSQIWGKLLFATSDIIAGVFIEKILQIKGVKAGILFSLLKFTLLLYQKIFDGIWMQAFGCLTHLLQVCYVNAELWMLNPCVTGMSIQN